MRITRPVAVVAALGVAVTTVVPASSSHAAPVVPASTSAEPTIEWTAPTLDLDLPDDVRSTAVIEPDATNRGSIRSSKNLCTQPPVNDATGDGTSFDIVRHELTGDCSTWTLTTTFQRPVDVSKLDTWVMQIGYPSFNRDCRGMNRAVFATVENGRLQASVYATPGCDSALWTRLGAAEVRRPTPSSLAVSFPAMYLGYASVFTWWAGVDRVGEGGFDAAPNKGWVRARVTPGPVTDLSLIADNPNMYDLTYTPPERGATYVTAELTRRGHRTVSIPITGTGNIEYLRDLEPGDYTVTMYGWNGPVRGAPARTRFIVPDPLGTVARSQPGLAVAVHARSSSTDEEARSAGGATLESGGVDAARLTPRSCDQKNVNDVAGDGPVDIAQISITSDCTTYRVVITTHQPFQDDQLRRLGLALGPVVEGNGDGCDGMMGVILVEPASGGLSADYWNLQGCNLFTRQSVAVERLSSASVAVTFSRRLFGFNTDDFPGFRWQAFAASRSSAQVDNAPGFPTVALDGLYPPAVSAATTADGTRIEVGWRSSVDSWSAAEFVSRFEARYREVGGRWSRTYRLGGNVRDWWITDAVPGRTYEISVTAIGPLGRRLAPIVTVRHFAPPGPVTNVRSTLSNGQLVVHFDLPTDTGGHRSFEVEAYVRTDENHSFGASRTSRTSFTLVRVPDTPVTVFLRAYRYRGRQYFGSDFVALRIPVPPPA